MASAIALLHEKLREAMKLAGYKELTEVQEKAIPKVLTGRHTLIVAPTGSGKTEAALFPIISKMLSTNYRRRIAVIYITPLRALNRDLVKRLGTICSALGLDVAVRHGDTPQSRRKLIAERPPHILITTPETLAYLLVNNRMRAHLRSVRWVVIDEFHEIMGSKRGSQLLVNLERLKEICGSYQRIALSASIGNVNLAKEMLAPGKVVEEVVIPKVRKTDIMVVPLSPLGRAGDVSVLADLIKKYGRVLIFTNTRDEAELYGSKLRAAGLNIRVHHGSLSRSEREEVEEKLRAGQLDAVVATSSLELGIDVGCINAVIQVSSPRQVCKLLQRIGRSMHKGWLAARGTVAVEFNADKILESVVIARRTLEGVLETPRPFAKPLDVLAHTLVGIGIEGGSCTVDKAYSIVTRSYPFLSLRFDEFLSVLYFLSDLGYIRLRGDVIEGTTKGRIYYLTTTMIVDTLQYSVIDVLTRRQIGGLDEEFVAMSVEEGTNLILGGKVWKVLAVDDESRKVFVEVQEAEEAYIPSWLGESIPVDYKVAREVCGIRRLIALGYKPEWLSKLAGSELIKYVESIVKDHVQRGYLLPSENNVVIEVSGTQRTLLVIHVCLGTLGNRALSLIITGVISKLLGANAHVKIDPYHIYIELPYKLPENTVKIIVNKVFKELNNDELMDILNYSIKDTALFKFVAFKILSRVGLIPKGAPSNVVKSIITRYSSNELVRREVMNEILTKYLDLEPVKLLLNRIREGRTRLTIVTVPGSLSPLASEGLKMPGGYEKVRTQYLPRDIVAELIKRRILSKEVLLICMVCGHYWSSKIADLPERISCPKCRFSLIGVSFNSDKNEVIETVRKGLKAGKNYKFVLSPKEKEVFEKLMDTAELVLNYGRKAVTALASYGVGPKVAKRILFISDEKEFYFKLHELEKQYIRTRRYWD
ncbi:MAG: DEAD/DEAH box helicase [Desulfurococcales archaeon]|nr:DEAD/DEAH box helicase [Desulfurococcales archaeon]